MAERALTIRQPWADLIMAGVKDVENRGWPVPSTVADVDPDEPPLWKCPYYRKRAGLGDPGIGDYGEATCSFGCYDEPVCVTGGPLPFPFRLWVHAGKRVDWPGDDAVWGAWEASTRGLGDRWGVDEALTGVLLGSVLVTDCHQTGDCIRLGGENSDGEVGVHGCSRWAELGAEKWHWTLTDPQPLSEPISMRGRQGLWAVEVPTHG